MSVGEDISPSGHSVEMHAHWIVFPYSLLRNLFVGHRGEFRHELRFERLQPLARSFDDMNIGLRREPVSSSLRVVASCNDAEQPCILSATSSFAKLFAYACFWCREATARTGCRSGFTRALKLWVPNCSSGIGLVHPAVAPLHYDAQVDPLGPGIRHELERDGAVCLLGQPERADQWDFRAAAGAFALDGARPEVGDGRRAVGVRRVELGQFLLRFVLDPVTPCADLIGEALTVLRDVFEHDLVEQDGDGIEVARKGIRAHAQGFERDGAAAGERVDDERPGTGRAAQRLVPGLGERAAGVEIFADGRVVPIGEVRDEVEQCLT